MTRRHLQDQEIGVGGGSQHRPRVAELVVERTRRGHHLTERRQHRRQQILGRGLARRPGDTDDAQSAGRQLGGHRGGQLGQRGEHRGPRPRWRHRVPAHPRRWRRPPRRAPRWRAHRPGARPARPPHPRRWRRPRNRCPSERAPGSARNSPPGVTARESNSTVPVIRTVSASAGAISASSPPTICATRASVIGIIGPARARVRASASSTRSSNGRVTPRLVCPDSWPLPAISTTSPGPRPGHRVVDGAPGGPRSRRPHRLPGGTGQHRGTDGRRILIARVVIGDDDEIGQFGGDPAHRLALAHVTVAARAEHHGDPAPPPGRATSAAPLPAPPACGRNRPAPENPDPGRWSPAGPAPPRHADRVRSARRDPDHVEQRHREQRVGDVVTPRQSDPQDVVHPGGVDGHEFLATPPDRAHRVDHPVGVRAAGTDPHRRDGTAPRSVGPQSSSTQITAWRRAGGESGSNNRALASR